MSIGESRPARISGLPRIRIIEEVMREGMQIERRSICTREKVELLNKLSRTGLGTIVVGSFVSPRWVPQMADIDEVIANFEPVEGVEYRALALNAKGVERRRRHVPPLTEPGGNERHRLRVHLSDVFVRRNTNRGQADEIAAWDSVVKRAVAEGATTASIEINAAWGSNWEGGFTLADRMEMLARQHRMWDEAGIAVDRVWLGDPMGWNTPWAVAETLREIRARWPGIREFHLHLHDTRGLALTSAYMAMLTLSSEHLLVIDTSLGGIGGCPYCGNGRATGMIATEDYVHLLQELGVDTGVDLDALVDVAQLLERVVGRRLNGRVSQAGPFPRGERAYPLDLPLIETLSDARHFLRPPTRDTEAGTRGCEPNTGQKGVT